MAGGSAFLGGCILDDAAGRGHGLMDYARQHRERLVSRVCRFVDTVQVLVDTPTDDMAGLRGSLLLRKKWPRASACVLRLGS